MRMPFIDSAASRRGVPGTTPTLRLGSLFAATLCVAACAVGPDYHKPAQDIPATFKEGTDWQRAQVDLQGAISSTWWLDYHDETLSSLVNQALRANQSIASAEAAYRLAKATIDANVASLFPTVGVDASGSRSRTAAVESVTRQPYMSNLASVSASASWEVDLWGSVRRQIESAKANAQASDAQLAGERLSIAASVAVDYFSLRQADVDIASLKQQQGIDARILEMDRAGFVQGTVSNDEVLQAQDTLELVIADLQATETSREQDEHAIAVLTGTSPASFALPPQPGYVFTTPAVPLGLPSQLLERRYDVVSAERTAAAANARIGVAKAAFFPTLTLSAQGGFEHNALANLFSVPNRFWTLGPDLAATIFDGGARSAAVHEAEATYDEQVAIYRGTVLSAFQSVEDSLSSYNHLCKQKQAYANIYQRNQRIFSSQQAQMRAGTTSEQALLTQQITLLQAGQNLKDTQAALTESSVTLVKNLGGGWQWDDARGAAVSISANAAQQSSDHQSGERSQ